ncbi:hypothetical protein HK101_011650 [Irineochytrium annulatum]|nr:hypothetical protein HK101_011650 [Irineochytrium annulatum]
MASPTSEDVPVLAPAKSTDTLKSASNDPSSSFIVAVGEAAGDPEDGTTPGALSRRPLGVRMREVVINYLPLAFVTFGGPQAHIALLLNLFVVKRKWLTERMFAELFSISNALPGPAGTKIAFTLALVRGGVFPGLAAFLLWSVPGGIVMATLGYGVSRLGQGGIPVWVKHVENGLDSVAVALVAGAAIKLTHKILTTRLTQSLAVISLAFVVNFPDTIWMIPLLMAFGGVVSSVEAAWPRWKEAWTKRRRDKKDDGDGATEASSASASAAPSKDRGSAGDDADEDETEIEFSYSPRAGVILISIALALLVVAAVLRSVQGIPTPLALIGTFYFVGTIIFGGGPVVVPLLYGYVVTNGWLSSSEFLIGLAITNAMPGPNFNFAAYCGALIIRDTAATSFFGALLAWIGIYVPGILLMAGVLPIWRKHRGLARVRIAFRGFNGVAIGLVYAATFLLWRQSIVVGGDGTSNLGGFPFYVGVVAVSYGLVEFYKAPSPLVVLLGGLVGFVEYLASR